MEGIEFIKKYKKSNWTRLVDEVVRKYLTNHFERAVATEKQDNKETIFDPQS